MLTWEEFAEAFLRRPANWAARQVIYGLCREGLPFVQAGRQRLFDREQCRAWLLERAAVQAEARQAPAPAKKAAAARRRPMASSSAPRTIAELVRQGRR